MSGSLLKILFFDDSIEHAHVNAILDASMEALAENSNRTFTYAELKFFAMWWDLQTNATRDLVNELVQSGQLDFVNGGWCMHDEAATHFIGMIDQTTLGHAFLKDKLGFIPKVGWQIDPFGHSSTQASYMTSLMGFDSLYFGRLDYQDLTLRLATRECEGLWDASPNVGSPVFWGLTGSYSGNYHEPPGGFCFDILCEDDPLVGWDDAVLLQRITAYVEQLVVQSKRTKGNHIMVTMGGDFQVSFFWVSHRDVPNSLRLTYSIQYQEAKINFQNLDLLIHSIFRFQESGQLDIPAMFGDSYKKIAIFYSNPDYYTEMKYEQTKKIHRSMSKQVWSTKTDDFFPYANDAHAYWTGYFTSRAGLKRLERVASSFLMAARQIASFPVPHFGRMELNDCDEALFDLADAVGVVEHHDALSGTSKQHVADDYAKSVQAGINKAQAFAAKKMKSLLLAPDDVDSYLTNLAYCQLLNETTCDVTEVRHQKGQAQSKLSF